MKCTRCGAKIHSSRKLCNKCAGVEPKEFVSADRPKTRGGIVDGVYMSGRNRAAKAGIANLRGILE